MKRFLLIIFLFLIFNPLISQNIEVQSNWQQKVNHHIKVELYPKQKCLIGFSQMTYYNFSPDTLQEIYFHLWANAYSNQKTAFAKQQIRLGNRDFHFSSDSAKGYINGLDFKVNNDSVSWYLDENHTDIALLRLNEMLLPGDSIVITTPFKVRFPNVFSRMGRSGSFFSATQWYPKPAVYDVNGWNAMPYLDQGEFYSEFGNYQVDITLPNNYFVASTGNLQNMDELQMLKSLKGGLLKGVNNGKRTLTYTENKIHDFAWFADTVFYVDCSNVVLNNGDTITTWLFSNIDHNKNNSRNATHPIFHVNKGVKKYSELIANYPYKQCTVVIGPLSAGAGMEYPTITICNSADEETIVHEIGHNWFYGILGSNERKYPWMDESINTYFQNQIMDKYKNKNQFLSHLKLREWLSFYYDQMLTQYNTRNINSQAVGLPSIDFTSANYGNDVYIKGPLLFAFLRESIGEDIFEKCVKNYYEEWKFKHPLPKDMQNSFEKTSEQNLGWFFEELLNTDSEIDIKTKSGTLSKVKGAPKLESYLKNHPQEIYNQNGYLPESKYYNNGQKKTLLKISFPYSSPSNKALVHLNLLPIVGYNFYDKIYTGLLLSNQNLFRRNIQFTGMTAYSFYAQRWVGYSQLNLLLLKNKSIFKTIESGIQGQTFGINSSGIDNQYYRFNPYLKLNFKHKKFDIFKSAVELNYYHTGLNNGITPFGRIFDTYYFDYLKLNYKYEYQHTIMPFKLNGFIEHGYNNQQLVSPSNYTKIGIIGEAKYYLNKEKKYFKTRIFAGKFLNSSGDVSRQQFYLTGNTGLQDYLYEDVLLGRSENYFDNNILGQNLINRNGNLRTNLLLSGTDKWMFSMNNEITLPGKIPFNVFYDFGVFRNPVNTISGVFYEKAESYVIAGISIPILEDYFEIYYPFVYSKSIKDIYDIQVFDKRNISFKLNLNINQPIKKLIGF